MLELLSLVSQCWKKEVRVCVCVRVLFGLMCCLFLFVQYVFHVRVVVDLAHVLHKLLANTRLLEQLD